MVLKVDDSLSMMEHIYKNEKEKKDQIFFTQPLGNDEVTETTYGDAIMEARKLATYLKSKGCEPGDKVGMISKNCDKFFIAEVAIWMAGCTTVAIFPNTNAKTVGYCLEHSEAKFLIVGKLDAYETLEGGFPDVPTICMPLAPEKAQGSFDHWDDVIAASEPLEGEPLRAKDDICLFIYTSGSTGTPKGVMHSFRAMEDSVHGILDTNKSFYSDDARILSYLPLAHIFERAYVLATGLVVGFHVYFAESISTFKDDLQRARPTLFISVPRLWLKFQQGVFAKFPEPKLNTLFSIPLIGSIIKGKILKTLGLNKVKLAGSGSAPIPESVLTWYRRLGLNLYEGYAMSEDFAYSHLSRKGFSKAGYVGVPYPGVKVKIDPETQEILIDSPGKMVGYYKMEEKTKESFDEEGYFKTGDRGLREANGMLKITGRLKEIFKTSKGKYVSPAPIENLLNSDALVELSLVGGSGYPQPYAVVTVAEALRPKLGEDDTRKSVESGLKSLLESVNSQIEHHEQLQFIAISSDEWSPENGCLTPTLKIKRAGIEDLIADKVEGWYGSGEKIVWE